MIYKIIKIHNQQYAKVLTRSGGVFNIPRMGMLAKYFKPGEDIIFVKATKTIYSFTIYKKLNPRLKKCQF